MPTMTNSEKDKAIETIITPYLKKAAAGATEQTDQDAQKAVEDIVHRILKNKEARDAFLAYAHAADKTIDLYVRHLPKENPLRMGDTPVSALPREKRDTILDAQQAQRAANFTLAQSVIKALGHKEDDEMGIRENLAFTQMREAARCASRDKALATAKKELEKNAEKIAAQVNKELKMLQSLEKARQDALMAIKAAIRKTHPEREEELYNRVLERFDPRKKAAEPEKTPSNKQSNAGTELQEALKSLKAATATMLAGAPSSLPYPTASRKTARQPKNQ